MRISRRDFAYGLAGGLAGVTAGASGSASTHAGLWERRVYAHRSPLPSLEVLRRSGIRPVSITRTPEGTAYLFPFVTLEARAKAWDRFNTDEEWCSIRSQSSVVVREIQVYATLTRV